MREQIKLIKSIENRLKTIGELREEVAEVMGNMRLTTEDCVADLKYIQSKIEDSDTKSQCIKNSDLGSIIEFLYGKEMSLKVKIDYPEWNVHFRIGRNYNEIEIFNSPARGGEEISLTIDGRTILTSQDPEVIINQLMITMKMFP